MAFSEWLTSPAWLFTAALASGAGLLLTDVAIYLAQRFRLHAMPNQRSSHTIPTPQLGGIGASIPTLAWLYYMVVAGVHDDKATHLFFFLFFGSSLLFFAIGLWDDLSNLPPKKKLLAQFVAGALATEVLSAIMVALSGSHAAGLSIGQTFTALVWLIWVVGFVNAFNFMDGMNGKAGLFTLNSLVFALVMMSSHIPSGAREPWFMQITQISAPAMATPAGITIGAVAGFMVFNCRPNARVFLGDCGSHFLGCFLATMAFALSSSLFGPGLSLLSFVVLLMPFLYDVTYTLVRRGCAGKKVWEAHREHLYQRLMSRGMSHMRVLSICAVTYMLCGALAVICVRLESLAGRFGCAAGSVLVMVAYTLYVVQVDRRVVALGEPSPGDPTGGAAT